jgi:hypothetical protein
LRTEQHTHHKKMEKPTDENQEQLVTIILYSDTIYSRQTLAMFLDFFFISSIISFFFV